MLRYNLIVREFWGTVFKLSRLCVGMIVVVAINASTGKAEGPGNPESAAPTVQDFRDRPLNVKDRLLSGEVAPRVDDEYLRKRLLALLSNAELTHIYHSAEKQNSLKYHAVIRFEIPESDRKPYDFHFPSLSTSSRLSNSDSQSGMFLEIYEKKISRVIEKFALTLGLQPEPSESKADILIRIDLAESERSAAGFRGPSLHFHQVEGAKNQENEIQETSYLLPWTAIRRDTRNVYGRESIVGGEIWIRYPVRIFWQESIARIIIDAPQLALELGFEASRQAILAKFVWPQKIDLPGLDRSLAKVRPVNSGKPHEKDLLTAALALNQDIAGRFYRPYGLSAKLYDCSADEHSDILAARVVRAFASMFGVTGGSTPYAVPLNLIAIPPNFEGSGGEGPLEMEQIEKRLLDISIGGYVSAFDQIVDDQLSGLILEELVLNVDQKQTPAPTSLDVVSRILRGQNEKIVEVLKTAALALSEDACVGRNQFLLTHLEMLRAR